MKKSSSSSTSTSTSHGSLRQKVSSSIKPQENERSLRPASSSTDPQDNYEKDNSYMQHFLMDRAYGPRNGKTPVQRLQHGKRSGQNPPDKLEKLVNSPEFSEDQWSDCILKLTCTNIYHDYNGEDQRDGDYEYDYNGEDQSDGDYEYEEGDEGDYNDYEGEIPDAKEGENADVEEDQSDGDYEYEEGDEGDHNDYEGEIPDAKEGENADVEEEYVDDEEGDHFAKKLGAMSRRWYG